MERRRAVGWLGAGLLMRQQHAFLSLSVLVLLFGFLPNAFAQSSTAPNPASLAANDRLFNLAFDDFSNLPANPDLADTVQFFLTFVTALDIQVSSITGDLENRMSIRDLVGRRNGETFLSIGHLAIEWDISDLPSGKLTVKRLLFDQVKIRAGWADRAADGLAIDSPDGSPEEALPAFEIFGFEMPRSPLSIDVRQLMARNLQLEEALVGQDVALDLSGRLLIPAGQKPIDTELSMVRRDQVRGAAQAKLRWQPESGDLTMVMGVEEAPNGLLQSLLGIDEKRSYNLLIEGRGPIRDWKPRIEFDLSGLVSVKGKMRLRSSATTQTARLTGEAQFLEDAQRTFPKLTSEPVVVDVQVGHRLNDLFRIDALSVSSKLLDAEGKGWIDPSTNDADISLNLRTKDETALQDLSDSLTLRAVESQVSYVKAGAIANLTIDGSAQKVGWADFIADDVEANIELSGAPSSEGEQASLWERVRVQATGQAERLKNLANTNLSISDPLTFDLDLDVEKEALRPAVIQQGDLRFSTQGLDLDARFDGALPNEKTRGKNEPWLTAARRVFKVDLDFEADQNFVRFAPWLNGGRARGDARLRNGNLNANIDFTRLDWSQPQLEAIAGQSITAKVRQNKSSDTLQADLILDQSGHETRIKTKINQDQSGTKLTASVPSFDLRFIPALNAHLEDGSVQLTADAHLTNRGTRLNFTANSSDLDLKNPRLRQLLAPGQKLELSGSMAAVPNAPIQLSDLRLEGGSLKFEGEASIPKAADIRVLGTGTIFDLASALNPESALRRSANGLPISATETRFIATGRGNRWDIDLNATLGSLANQNPLVQRFLTADDQVSARVQVREGTTTLSSLEFLPQAFVAGAPRRGIRAVKIQQVGGQTFTGTATVDDFNSFSENIPASLKPVLEGIVGEVRFSVVRSVDAQASQLIQGRVEARLGSDTPETLTPKAQTLIGTVLQSDFAWSKPAGLTLSQVRVQKDQLLIEGDVLLHPNNRLRSSTLQTKGLNLNLFDAWLPALNLRGLGRGSMLATSRDGTKLSLDYNFKVDDFSADNKTGRLIETSKTLSLIGQVQSTLGKDFLPKARLFSEVRANGLGVRRKGSKRAKLNVNGRLTRLRFDLDSGLFSTTGFENGLKASGVLGFQTRDQKLDFKRFDLRIDGLKLGFRAIKLRADAPIYFRHTPRRRFLSTEGFKVGDADLKAKINLSGDTVNGAVSLDAPDLAWLNQYPSIASAKGRAKFDLILSGAASNPIGLGSFRIQEAQLQQPRQTGSLIGDLPTVSGRGKANLKDGVLSLSGSLMGQRQLNVDALLQLPMKIDFSKYSVRIDPKASISGQFTGDMSAQEAAEYLALERDELGGKLAVDVRVSGSLEKPNFTGAFNWLNARYENEATGLLLEGLDIKGTARGDRLTLVSDGGSNIALRGHIDIKPKANFPVQLEIQSQRANLIARDDANLLVSSFLRLNGALRDRLNLVGDIVINEAEVRMPNLRGSNIVSLDVIEINRPEGLSETPVDRPTNQNLQTRLRIRSENNLNFRGAGVAAKWGLNLRVSGPIGKPILSGALSSNLGGMTLLGKRFKLVRAELAYSSQAVEDPSLNVLMERETDGLLIQLSVLGSVQKPEVEITSVPELPTEQVISQLLFNSDPNQLNGVQAIELVTALTRLQNFGRSEDFVERLRLLTGLDSLTLAANSSNETALRAGKNITPRTQIWVEQGFSRSSTRIGTEFRILPNLTLESDYGLDEEGRVELDWSFDY